ncbi:MAG: hypothetical protein ACOYD4_12170 [Solirubrobacterales bacterium]
MYSMPVIVAPAAAVATGSCQTSSRRREVSGLEAANAAATSAALPSLASTAPSPLNAARSGGWRPPGPSPGVRPGSAGPP